MGKGVSAHYDAVVKYHSRQEYWNTHSLLNISEGLASGEVRVNDEVRRGVKDIRAVGQSRGVEAELAHSLEDELEAVLELGLVGCWDCSSVGSGA